MTSNTFSVIPVAGARQILGIVWRQGRRGCSEKMAAEKHFLALDRAIPRTGRSYETYHTCFAAIYQ